MPDASITPAAGVGSTFGVLFLDLLPRSLYLYANRGVWDLGLPAARSLYTYANRGIWAFDLLARSLYLYANRSMYPDVIAIVARALYLYEVLRDGEVVPYLNHLNPTEQYESGQVDLYGDGFGQHLDAFATAPTVTVSSTNGSNVKEFATNRLSSEWQSTSGAAAWIRFTWGAAKRIVGVVLEGSANGTSWGLPRFKFDDASQQDGTPTVPATAAAYQSAEIPVGGRRQVYWLATPKVSTYVEVAIASGGSGTNRGFCEVWVVEEADPEENAEASRAVLNLALPSEQTMGIVSWLNRSPNWWPANGGVAPTPAATVTVPSGAVSGLVYVEEST